MIVYVLIVFTKTVSKRKVCIIFIKNKKCKKPKKPTHTKKQTFLVGFFLVIWMGFYCQRCNKVVDLEKKQRNFDKILAEEKLNAERISAERDNAERDAREKETKLLNLNRELEDQQTQLDESRRARSALQAELDDLVNSQGTAD